MPLIGRHTELAIVRQFVAAGTGGVLAVTGEAGIGKSRLLSEAAALAVHAGLTVHTGRAVEGNGSYRAVAQALAGVSGFSESLRPYRAALGLVLPAWRSPNDSISVDPAVLLGEGLIRLLDGALLVLDDLQWADPETAALVTYLAEAAPGRRLLVAIALRTDEPARLSPTPAMTVLALDRLAPEGAFAQLVRAADGLPLVIEELAHDRSTASSPASSLAAIVRARTDRLTAVQRTILGAAALLGDAPVWTLLPTVTGYAEPVVLEALDAAHGPLLVDDPSQPGRLAWRHGLIREHVLAALTAAQRSALAARTAAALGDDPAAADLFVVAGQCSRATALLLRLARRERSVPGALALLDRAEPTPAVLAERVRLLTALGRAPEALDLGPGLLGRLRGDAHAATCLDLAEAAVATRRWADAERYLERAGRPGQPRSLVIAADAAFGPGDLARARRLASEVPDTTDDARSLIHSCIVRARCEVRSDPDAGRVLYGRAAQLAAEHGLAAQRVVALLGLATIDLDFAVPPVALDEARELALDTGQLAQVVWIDHLLTDRAIVLDGPGAAEPVARRAVELAGQLRLTGLQAVGEAYLALCRQLAGDTAGARTLLDQASARPAAPLEVAAAASVVEAARHLLAHDLRAATAALDAGLRPLLGRDETAPLFAFGLWALLSTVAGGPLGARPAAGPPPGAQPATGGPPTAPPATGGPPTAALLSTVAGEPSIVDLVDASPAAGRAANRAGLLYASAVLARDPVALAAADRVLPEPSWWRRLLRLIAWEAAVDGGWGDPVPALRVDLEAFTASGDEHFARTARDLLRRAGAPTRRGRGTATVPDRLRAAGVTSREMDVLRLVAAGLSNKEIAERLFLSPRTVETHVARLLAKTGTATRNGLGALSP